MSAARYSDRDRRRWHEHRRGHHARPRSARRRQDADDGRRRLRHPDGTHRGAAAGGYCARRNRRRDDRHDALHERIRPGALPRARRRHPARRSGHHEPATVHRLARRARARSARSRHGRPRRLQLRRQRDFRGPTRRDPADARRRCAQPVSGRSRSRRCSPRSTTHRSGWRATSCAR